jgi:hypothetical protein
MLFALLPVEGILLLARKFGWFGFAGGWNGAVERVRTVITVSILLILFWSVGRFAVRRRLQYRVRLSRASLRSRVREQGSQHPSIGYAENTSVVYFLHHLHHLGGGDVEKPEARKTIQ